MKRIALLLLTLLMASCGGPNDSTTPEVTITEIDGDRVFLVRGTSYEVEAAHPLLESDFINQTLTDIIEAEIDTFARRASSMKGDEETGRHVPRLSVGYVITNSLGRYLSVAFTLSEYKGEQEANIDMVTAVFDLDANVLLTLDDMFADERYMTTVSDLVRSRLLEEDDTYADWIIKDVDRHDRSHFDTWLLDDEHLVFLFDAEENEPDTVVSEVSIPLSELKTVLRPQFMPSQRERLSLELRRGSEGGNPDRITLSDDSGATVAAIDLPSRPGTTSHVDAMPYEDIPVLALYHAFRAGIADLFRLTYDEGRLSVEHMVVHEPHPELDEITCEPWTEIGSFSIESGRHILIEFGNTPADYPTDFDCDCVSYGQGHLCRDR